MKKSRDINWNKIRIIISIALMFIIWVTLNDGWKKILSPPVKTLTIGAFSDSYWGVENGYSYRILDEAIALFESEHPDIQIQYQSGIIKSDYSEWLAEQILQGDAPDVFFMPSENLIDLAEIGALKNLSALAQSDRGYDASVYYPSAYQCGMYDNALYTLPYECAPRLMFVNKSILDAEQIEMPGSDWTWNDFYEICEKVTKDKNQNGMLDQYGVTGYGWEDTFDSNEVALFNSKGSTCNLTGLNVTEAVTFLERLKKLSDGYSVTSRDFTVGNVAFQPLLFSEYRAYKSYPLSIKKYSGFDWECLTMPSGPHGSNRSRLNTLSLAMNARSIYQAESWEFMKFLTQDERVQKLIFEFSEGVSVLPSVTDSDSIRELMISHSGESHAFNMEILKDAMEHAVVEQGFHNYDLAVDAVGQTIDEVIDVDGETNISMELIIQNRKLNNYLQSLKQQ